jgi:hypothetical protein
VRGALVRSRALALALALLPAATALAHHHRQHEAAACVRRRGCLGNLSGGTWKAAQIRLAVQREARGCGALGASFKSLRLKWSAKTVCVFVCNSCAAVAMKADGFQVPAGVKKALAPAVAALSIAAPAFAEGTGEVSRGLHGPCERLWLAKPTPASESCLLLN